MSETVKLIIEIPKIDYEQTCNLTLHKRAFWDNDIRNGIPLDDVKAEIEKVYEDFDGYDPSDLSEFFKRVYEILNSVGKGDKEKC